MWPYPWTHVGTASHLGHMDRVAATMPSQAHAGAAQEAPDIGQSEGQDVPLVRPSSCNVKRRHPELPKIPTYLPQCGRRAAVNCPAPAPGSGGVRCSTTPPWSLARPRAPRVWLGPLPGPSRTRYAGEEGQVGWRPRVWRCPLSLLQAGRWGPVSAAPFQRMWEEVAGVSFVSDTMGC